MADEDGWDDGSEPSEDEDQQQGPRRVKPLFSFLRNNDEGGGEEPPEPPEDHDGEEDEPDAPQRVRPVRVVKFVPAEEAEEPVPGEDGEAPFTVAEEVVDETPPFAVAEEVVDEAPPFAVAEEVSEGGEFPFTVAEEVVVEEAPSLDTTETAFEEDEAPFVMAEEVEERAGFVEAANESVLEVPFAVIEEAEREDVVDDGASAEEEAELGDDLKFRQEETPVKFQEEDVGPAQEPVPGEGAKPHYHKYLKPDEELLESRPTKGRPTGFDRDLESEAGEIDFGIDLIDPSERRKKRSPKKGLKESGPQQKGAVGGHDFDAEVGTKELGVDIGVDYTKRRKRRL